MKTRLSPPCCLSLLLVCVGLTTGFESPLRAAQQPAWAPDPVAPDTPPVAEKLQVKIISGQNGVNIVRRQFAVTPVVEVRDSNNHPVAGAVVNFTAPDLGASITFLTGGHTFSAVTEMDGRAAAPGVLPNGSGAFSIQVTASYSDHIMATGAIQQTNYQTAADATKAGATVPVESAEAKAERRAQTPSVGLSRGAITAIVLAIAGGAAAGIAVGLAHGGGSGSSATVGVGTPTAGAPH